MTGTFALFDMANFITPAKRIIPPLLIVMLAALATPWPAFGVIAAAIAMSLLAPNPFADDERGHLDTLYATLPITRRTVVTGRYLALIVLYLVVALVATLAAVIISLIKGNPIGFDVLGLVNLVGVLIFAILLAVQLPFFFSVGFTRGRPMMYMPLAVLAGGAWLAGQTGLLSRIDLGSVTSLNPVALWVSGLAIAVLALVASAGLSSVRYGRRAL
jgi:ABC-type transport system involved in multi-copper enzyme maturation permease subunit